jgi:hypothetical protein
MTVIAELRTSIIDNSPRLQLAAKAASSLLKHSAIAAGRRIFPGLRNSPAIRLDFQKPDGCAQLENAHASPKPRRVAKSIDVVGA